MPHAGRRDPAPDSLRIVQGFVNTKDVEAGRERLNSPAALHEWLVEQDLIADEVELSVGDLIRAVEVREAIRALLAAHNGLPVDVQIATTHLNAAAERAEFVPQLDLSGRSRLEPRTTGLDHALGQILAAIHAAIANGTWERMKACESNSCRWAFFDHSKNRSGRWCQAATCGARERSRRAYQRRRAKT